MTVVYLIRHCDKERNLINDNNNLNVLEKNRAIVLSVQGEKDAFKLSNLPFLQDVSVIYSSNYPRAIASVKYLANKLNKPIYLNENFGERVREVTSENLPFDFEYRQIKDNDYKSKTGESINEVAKRMVSSLNEVVKKNRGSKIVVCSHATAILSVLLYYGEVLFNEDIFNVKFHDKLIFSGHFSAPLIFKLVYDDDVIDIENIDFN